MKTPRWKIYYYNTPEDVELSKSKRFEDVRKAKHDYFKYIRAKNAMKAIEFFRLKYPDLTPAFALME